MHFSVSICTCILLSGIIIMSCQKQCTVTPISKNDIIIIDAGKSQIVSVTGDTAKLTGNVLSGRPSITSYAWSTISGPNSPAISNGDSVSSVATGLTAGVYVFQLKASSPDNVGLDTTTVIVTKTIILRIDSTTNGKAYNFQLINTSDGSNPSGEEIFAGAWTSGGLPYDTKSGFLFDLNQLPANSTIVSAKLTLYSDSTPLNGDHLGDANSGANNAFYLERMTGSWNYTSSWFNIPTTDTANGILVPSTVLPQLDIADLDVTGMVKTMYTTNNYGFQIRMQDTVPYTTRIFCAGYYPQVYRHPKLEILYH